ncbi:MAG: hypothetical protein QOD13_128 [Thermoleophilaceae bacterium]|jgi:hypothetical protein|nr:hypothetical protein [Thermoleophilaceae bacterium]
MGLDPAIAAALSSLRTRRDAITHAIAALEALDDGNGSDSAAAAAAAEIARTHAAPAVTRTQAATSVGGGAAGARRVLRAAPGEGFTAAKLAKAMLDNGWVTPSKNPRAAARAAGNRLRETAEEHVFFEDGQFVYRPPGDELEGLGRVAQEEGDP